MGHMINFRKEFPPRFSMGFSSSEFMMYFILVSWRYPIIYWVRSSYIPQVYRFGWFLVRQGKRRAERLPRFGALHLKLSGLFFFFCWGHTWQWKIQMFRVTQSVIYKLWLSPCHVWCTKGYPKLNHALHRQLVQPWDSWQAMRMSAATPTSDRIHPNLGVFERWVFPQFTAICIGKIWENDEAANLRLSGYPAIPFSR